MKKILLSTVLSLVFYPAFSQCVPQIFTDCFTAPDYIDSVVVTNALVNFSNVQTGCNGQDFNYNFHQNHTATEEVGGTFDLDVALNSSNPSYIGVWVDWNDDLTFAVSEQIYLSTGLETSTNLSVPVPGTAVLDTVLIRVRSSSTLTDACNNTGSGETEDYNLLLVTPTDVEDIHNTDLSWSVFPNPASDKVNIRINDLGKNLSYELIDVVGKVVINDNINKDLFSIDTSKLPRGIYFLSLNNNGNKLVKKVMIN